MKENIIISVTLFNLILLFVSFLMVIRFIIDDAVKYPTLDANLHNTNIRYELTGSEWGLLNHGDGCIYTLSLNMKRMNGDYSNRYLIFKNDCSLEYSTGIIYFKPDKYE